MVKIYKQPFAHDGDTIAIPDVSQPDGKMSSADGWTVDYQLPKTNPNYKPVGRREMNGVFKEVTEALGQVQVQGSATWSAVGAPYPVNAQVYHNGKQWIALRANSAEPADGEDWAAVDTALRQDLANPDKGAALIGNALIRVSDVHSLIFLPEWSRKSDTIYEVISYRPDHTVGGGSFLWDELGSRDLHNGGTVIDPSRPFPNNWSDDAQVSDWLSVGGSGFGVFKRLNKTSNVLSFGSSVDLFEDSSRQAEAAINSTGQVEFPQIGVTFFNRPIEPSNIEEVVAYGAALGYRSKIVFESSSAQTLFKLGNLTTLNKFHSENLDITAITSAGLAAPCMAETLNCEKYLVKNCSIKDCTLRGLNNSDIVMDEFSVVGCDIDCDFSMYDLITVQNDVIVSRGFKKVEILKNDIICNNVNRVMKIQKSSLISIGWQKETSPNKVDVIGNTVVGSTTSSKQVIDMFTVIDASVTIENNDFEVNGFSTCIENKSNKSSDVTSLLITQIIKNTFSGSSLPILLQGQKGNLTDSGAYSLGSNVVVIDKNHFNIVGGESLDFRYLDRCEFTSNVISTDGASSMSRVMFSSNLSTSVKDNDMVNSYIFVQDLTASYQSDVHSVAQQSVVIDGNSFYGGSLPAQGFIVFRGINSEKLVVSVSDNAGVSEDVAQFSSGFVLLRDLTCYAVAVSGNSVKMENPSYERVFKGIGPISVNFYSETGNSWNGTPLTV